MSAYWARGWVYEQKREWDQMLADYTVALRINPTEAILITGIGFYYYRATPNDYERAISSFTDAIRINPNRLNAYMARADCYRMLRDYDKAILDCDSAIRINSNWNQIYIVYGTRGVAYHQKGDNVKALSDLNESIRLNPNYAWAHDARARVYKALNRNDLAESDTSTYNRLRAAGYH